MHLFMGCCSCWIYSLVNNIFVRDEETERQRGNWRISRHKVVTVVKTVW
jgi:hypothetical protein